MQNSQNVTIKIIAPDLYQLKGSANAIEFLSSVYIEGRIFENDQDGGTHLFLTFPLNWFSKNKNKNKIKNRNKNAVEPASHNQPITATTVNHLTEVTM
ncbi:MAG: hypothetical protein WC325_08395 [Candidatus Bathyarchaeia archaeon]|jgi:hypothetical protein